MNVVTIPKKLIQKGDLLVVEKRNFERLTQENAELRMAIRAILAGEVALRRGKTRSFRAFLENKFPQYA
ncbi:MAG: hypothetical protein HY007_01980 [Candidatus Sungbacteria bacterium]|nr:hypothetical protein [Candidatus Sungbacteria bacterium]